MCTRVRDAVLCNLCWVVHRKMAVGVDAILLTSSRCSQSLADVVFKPLSRQGETDDRSHCIHVRSPVIGVRGDLPPSGRERFCSPVDAFDCW